jgi:hypothetical protein
LMMRTRLVVGTIRDLGVYFWNFADTKSLTDLGIDCKH